MTRASTAVALLVSLACVVCASASPYTWKVGGYAQNCSTACAYDGRSCYPLAVPSWTGWPTTSAAFSAILATLQYNSGTSVTCTTISGVSNPLAPFVLWSSSVSGSKVTITYGAGDINSKCAPKIAYASPFTACNF